jgi:hypothetical protein
VARFVAAMRHGLSASDQVLTTYGLKGGRRSISIGKRQVPRFDAWLATRITQP